MCTPSVTLRSLKNEDTGIDISVPRFKEEEAPLGGISILYEISVLTRLDLFKTRLHKSGDVVHFTLYKAYREIEDLYNKLNKKYPKAGLPPVPKASTSGKYTCDEKKEALDIFMRAIAKNMEICYSSIFTQFIGINSQRLPSFSIPESSDSSITNVGDDILSSEAKKELPDDSEMFPKMKNIYSGKDQPSLQPTMKNVDLFEEVKLTKENITTTTTASKKGGLFDEFDDDNLFTTKSAEKPKSATTEKPKENVPDVKKPEVIKHKKDAVIEQVDDSEIIIQDRKPGDVSLFKEQDLGGFITKDEESLFLVTSPSSESKKNTLLFSEDEILSPDSDQNVDENLDDLLNLEPLPKTAILNKKSENEETLFETSTKEQEPPKPLPRVRNSSFGQAASNLKQEKPEVAPRKVFKDKPKVPSKPAVPAKPLVSPAGQAKPVLPPKPKAAPKILNSKVQNDNPTKNLDAVNANEVKPTENMNTVSNLANDLKELDILKYIEQEEKSLDSQLNLFD